ncbi:Uncharacterised protein [Mycobacteroides abscessus]|nr:Uncharacterised protein [Mycobacteroides abscessus]
MPAGHDERHDALGERAVHELVDGRVADDVVHAVERLAEREREGLRGGGTDGQRADEARPGGDGDRVDLGEVDVGRAERALERGDHRLEMGARRDLGDDPAVARVLVHGARDRVDEQLATADERHARLVAGRLDAEHQGLAGARGSSGDHGVQGSRARGPDHPCRARHTVCSEDDQGFNCLCQS